MTPIGDAASAEPGEEAGCAQGVLDPGDVVVAAEPQADSVDFQHVARAELGQARDPARAGDELVGSFAQQRDSQLARLLGAGYWRVDDRVLPGSERFAGGGR